MRESSVEEDAVETPLSESNMSVLEDDPSQTIWGDDAQQRWRELAGGDPVLRRGAMVIVVGPPAVDEVLHAPATFSSRPEGQPLGSEGGLIPLQINPPDHVRYRKLLDPLFAPRNMNPLEPSLVALVNDRIDEFIGDGRCDFSSQLAIPFPCEAFMKLMGLPLEDLDQFVKFKDDIIRPVGPTEELEAMRAKAGQWVYGYFAEALDKRQVEPADDLIQHILGLEDAGTLSRAEALNICFMMVIAGLDTVTDSLECFFAFLGRSPEHRRQLSADPALINNAVEELLRWMSPVPALARYCEQDAEVQGCPVHQGDRVSVLIAPSNLMPNEAKEPLEVDFARQVRHIGFGAGVHRCLGSHLARLELRVVLREWHRRIPEYEVPADHVMMWRPSLREVTALPLVFPPGGGGR